MKTECRFATAETLDQHTIKVVSKKQADKTVVITDENEIVSIGFDTARFYAHGTWEATNDFTVNYTVKLPDGKYQYCKYWLDRTTLDSTEEVNPTRGRAFKRHVEY